MKRKHKKYSKPKRPFDKVRIDEEAEIKEEFGLKNKKEIWMAEAGVKLIRKKAKKLISANPAEQKAFFERIKKTGFNINSIGGALALDKTDYLKRRLQTLLVTKKIAKTSKEARQFITHRKVFVGDALVDSPSYIVPLNLEDKIKLKTKKKKKQVPKEEIKNE